MTFKGKIDQPSNMDFVYWLNQHLMKNFNTSLSTLKDSLEPIAHNTTPLWKWSRTAMSIKLRYYTNRLFFYESSVCLLLITDIELYKLVIPTSYFHFIVCELV